MNRPTKTQFKTLTKEKIIPGLSLSSRRSPSRTPVRKPEIPGHSSSVIIDRCPSPDISSLRWRSRSEESGCDTTSALFCQGKVKFCSLIEKHQYLQTELQIFLNHEATSDQVAKTGEIFLIHLYGGNSKCSASQ
ncbi:hypothetical protein JTE90_025366 [Oedothorax gibbosus]|uniref:Uncharacterized protein n=1 Tax=Oedothorax gibbosus TaxID=931172 RepID=A0AAV6UBM9_9ARAC|nr:hypothetical protein JTE90_025366 [Oedothorax gibbosus]